MAKRSSSSGKRRKGPRSAPNGEVIDLAQLGEMHPRLPADLALLIVSRAALGLQRNRHLSGTRLPVTIQQAQHPYVLKWPAADPAAGEQHDQHRITEHGAEAISLAAAHKSMAWRVVRRMQREECADWLLEHREQGARKLVAFEVSGIDRGGLDARVREKLAQVARGPDVDQRWVGIVGFERPEAELQSVEAPGHDR